jgi:hypothetical protein
MPSTRIGDVPRKSFAQTGNLLRRELAFGNEKDKPIGLEKNKCFVVFNKFKKEGPFNLR